MRPKGLSAFVRCKNEEEYIIPSLLSGYRVFDEIVLVLNNSLDSTRELASGLLERYPKIRILDYPNECSPIGPGYIDAVCKIPESSLALYYNWCTANTRFSHVCKWDGDMIATPVFEGVREFLGTHDVIAFDGYDVLGKDTTNVEPRIFRYDTSRARYVDWDMYEVLQHDYRKIATLPDKCYLHMKLVKRDWLHRDWSNPNLLATRSVPETGAPRRDGSHIVRSVIRGAKRLLRGK